MRTLDEKNYELIGVKSVNGEQSDCSKLLFVFRRKGVDTVNFELYDDVRFKMEGGKSYITLTDDRGIPKCTLKSYQGEPFNEFVRRIALKRKLQKHVL